MDACHASEETAHELEYEPASLPGVSYLPDGLQVEMVIAALSLLCQNERLAIAVHHSSGLGPIIPSRAHALEGAAKCCPVLLLVHAFNMLKSKATENSCLTRCGVCKTHICWLCGEAIPAAGLEEAQGHYWIKGTPCYGMMNDDKQS